MPEYKYVSDNPQDGVIHIETKTQIPVDPNNTDYKTYLEYVGGGGVTEPWKTDEESKAYYKKVNQMYAYEKQKESISLLIENDKRKELGLHPLLSDDNEQEHKDYIKRVEDDIKKPSEDPDYKPELPPGVIPPPYGDLVITVTRLSGWNDVLGWRATIDSFETDVEPNSTAMAAYSQKDCTDYLFTTGAFQEDPESNTWYADCPVGQEIGDKDIHFGVLYGSVPLSCFTLPKGYEKMTVTVYTE